MGCVTSSQSAVQKTQRQWAKQLKHIHLEDLKLVITFSSGAFSNVSLVQLRNHPDSSFALKIVQKAMVTDSISRQNILLEKKILAKVRSDFIVKLYRTFQDRKCLYMLTEYLPGGELFNRMPVTEDAAKFYVACVVEALDCLHSQNIVHNDLKPENVVIGADGYAKLIDFGVAQKLRRGQQSYMLCGTYAYIAPELAWPVIEKRMYCSGRDRAVDLWALGVVTHNIVAGTNAFDENNNNDEETTCRNITRGIRSVVRFSRTLFSEGAENFILELCVDSPRSRLGYKKINDMRKHRWFKDFNWVKLRNRSMIPPFLPEVCSVVDTRNFDMRVATFDLVEEEQKEMANWNF